jgi:hypothetical protein
MTRKVLASASLAACLAITALSGTALSGVAQAAPMAHTTATMAFASTSVEAGVSPVLTYLTTNTPPGSVIYLERAAGRSQAWQPVARMSAADGTVRAPADPAGQYSDRLLVTDGRQVVATSATESLTVSAKPGGGCGVCAVAKGALPWLTPIVTPIISYVVQAVAPAVWAWIVGLFAL